MSAQELKSLATAGRLHPEDLVRHGRETAWVPAGRLKGLFTGSATPLAANPGSAAAPSGQAAIAPRTLSPPAGASRTADSAPPAAFDRGGRPLPPLPDASPRATSAVSPAEMSADAAGPLSGRVPAPDKPPQPMGGLEFLEEAYSAPASFRAPRPKSSISDVLEQKRQRERRNLTILAGVAGGLMLVLGVLMTILFFKQHAAVPEAVGRGTMLAPRSEPPDNAAGGETGATETAGRHAAADLDEIASKSSLPAAPRKAIAAKAPPVPEHSSPAPPGARLGPPPAASKMHLAERAPPLDRPAKNGVRASAKVARKPTPQPKSAAGADELPPPTGDPEEDLGIGADMPPPGEPTPWSALPEPPRKPSLENSQKHGATR